MSDTSFRFFVAFLYVFVVGTMMYVCSDFLDGIKANSNSQNRAAWANVYWARRNQRMVEKDWQEKWEALHSTAYCRQKIHDEAVEEMKALKGHE